MAARTDAAIPLLKKYPLTGQDFALDSRWSLRDIANRGSLTSKNTLTDYFRGGSMDVSRRNFLRLSVAAASGTALGGLVGSGVNLGPAVARAQELRIKNAKVTPSVCPYCSVGCATLIHTVDGHIVNIEGDPRSPHSEGTLCPKGAAIYQLHVNPNRATKVLHRKPGATNWEEVELEWAMDRVAELIRTTRDQTFIERLPNGKVVNMTPAIFALGGATLDNEFNHVCQKFWRGLGVVGIENQARI